MGSMLAGGEELDLPAAQREWLGVQQVDVDRPLDDRRRHDHAGDDDRVAPVEMAEHDPHRERRHDGACE